MKKLKFRRFQLRDDFVQEIDQTCCDDHRFKQIREQMFRFVSNQITVEIRQKIDEQLWSNKKMMNFSITKAKNETT